MEKLNKIGCIVMLFTSLQMHSSCKNFLEVGPPKTSLVNKTIFKNDIQAIAALTSIYAAMAAGSYASGSNSVSLFGGLSSDEMIGYGTYLPPYENQLYPEYTTYASLYSGPYKSIYTANSILEGIPVSTALTPASKMLLEGEALFVRAFAYFNLVNLFGSVPLHLTTDYRETSIAVKSSVAQVYEQVLKDLHESELLLTDVYPTGERVRPNKSAVQALLARTYLYLGDWTNAEKYASMVIGKSALYSLVKLEAVFLTNCQETIWQLMPLPNRNTQDGDAFIPANLNVAPTQVSLSTLFVLNAFEEGDKRRDVWIKSYTNAAGNFYYPFKYKVRSGITSVSEYSTVLRLAELYLIRAEARIHLNNIANGIADLNLIRLRPVKGVNANTILSLSSDITKYEALVAVEKERRVELFSEWGHRWFDLKRTGKTDAVLKLAKPLWQETDVLYPIPESEVSRNHNINQNEGY